MRRACGPAWKGQGRFNKCGQAQRTGFYGPGHKSGISAQVCGARWALWGRTAGGKEEGRAGHTCKGKDSPTFLQSSCRPQRLSSAAVGPGWVQREAIPLSLSPHSPVRLGLRLPSLPKNQPGGATGPGDSPRLVQNRTKLLRQREGRGQRRQGIHAGSLAGALSPQSGWGGAANER